MPKLSTEAGTVFILSDDLGSYESNFFYALYDFPTGRALASVNRMRGNYGEGTNPSLAPKGDALLLSKQRFENQLTSTVAKLLGLSFPCQHPICVLRRPVMIQQIDTKSSSFCPKHAQEWKEISKARGFRQSP